MDKSMVLVFHWCFYSWLALVDPDEKVSCKSACFKGLDIFHAYFISYLHWAIPNNFKQNTMIGLG